MKKAQMEMVGLVVIVILITLGMLFLAIFSFNTDTQKKIFTRKGLASSTIGALMKTTIDGSLCGTVDNLEFEKKILEDCARNFPEERVESEFQCNGQHSCTFFREFSKERLEEVLGSQNKKYQLQSRLIPYPDAGENEIESIVLVTSDPDNNIVCPRTSERDSSGLFPLNVEDGGFVESNLIICD